MKKMVFIFFFTFILFHLIAQKQTKIDSLEKIIKETNSDTILISSLNELAWELKYSNPDTAFHYTNLALEKLKHSSSSLQKWNKKMTAKVYKTIGILHYIKGNHNHALAFYQKALTIGEEIHDNDLIANIYNNIGILKKVQGNNNGALEYYQKALDIYEGQDANDMVSSVYNNIGIVFESQGNYNKALEYYQKALQINEQIENKQGRVSNYTNIGNILSRQGNYTVALDYYHQSLKLCEELGNTSGVAGANNNIGLIHQNQNEHETALKYYEKAMKIFKELDHKERIALSYNNIGEIYVEMKEYGIALEYHRRSLQIRESLGDINNMACSYLNIGDVYQKKEETNLALDYYKKALLLFEQGEYKSGMASSYINMGQIYAKQNNYPLALSYLEKGMILAEKVGNLVSTQEAYEELYLLYEKMNNSKNALTFYKKYIMLRDSAINKENTKEITQREMRFEFEKTQEIARLEQEKKDALATAESKRQKVMIILISLLFVITLLFAFFIFNRFRVTRQQKRIIEQQKIIVDQKNKNIMDSINYAKRIQDAILPLERNFKTYLPDSFILFKPKDVVSGDFYYLSPVENIKKEKNNLVIFAVVDCTGHGVPGAFMSIVGYNGLNQAVKEQGITKPSNILHQLNRIVNNSLQQSKESTIRDGMDIALCSLAFPISNSSNTKLQFAGANNSIYIVGKKVIENTLHERYICYENNLLEIKADKHPIGAYVDEKLKPFTNHEIELNKGDTIYIFSDGFADQFGGPNGKKFKYKSFKELLLSCMDKTMEEQKEILNTTIENWKGDLEQVDDICVIGIRI